MRTLIVGAGISGLACADALAGWGQDVEVYEARGRTHGDRNGRRLSGRGRR
ncbi:NAD(P)-binding protein [uncultured Actinomyces sp.]|uniref:NAD(P)-binding protein n=1 Tax=uncultured Actinomyces sp. TaxID=249061 RepID=UPI0028E5FAA5|nr:NAD(P)-binding protein [uncultured Actinomyces sp.]